MLKFSLTLPIILSSLYISCSQAQSPSLPSCAQSCAQSAAYQAGCDINDPTCVCQNPTFITDVYSCVQQSCSAPDIQAAAAYWAALCSYGGPTSGIESTPIPSTYGPPSSSATGPVSSLSQSTTGSVSSSSVYGYPPATTSTPITSPSVTSSNTVPSSSTGSSGTGSSTTGSSGTGSSSSKTSGSSSSSKSTSSSTSNLAATMPTHAAALVAGGIGALVAAIV